MLAGRTYEFAVEKLIEYTLIKDHRADSADGAEGMG
jgi:hypothetical protein